MTAIAQVQFELTHFEAAIQHFNPYAKGIPRKLEGIFKASHSGTSGFIYILEFKKVYWWILDPIQIDLLK